MKKLITILSIFVLFSPVIFSQTINTRFSTYFYTYQRMDSLGTNGNTTYTTHLQGYQNLLLDGTAGKWNFNTFLQTDEDVVNKNGRGFAYRFYSLYLKGSNLFNHLDVKLGRQYVSAGTGKGTIDGAYLKLKMGENKEYQLIGYGGELTPLTYDITEYPSISKNYSLGAQFLYYGVKDLMVGLSYQNKRRQPVSYYATRADSAFNTQQILIETDSKADQTAGLDVNYSLLNRHNFYGKAYFDINLKKFSRGEFNANIQLLKELRVSGDFIYREPQISYNTIFWVFTHGTTQEYEGGVDYLLNNNFNFYTRIGNVIYNGDHSLKFLLGVNNPFFGISFVKYDGYAGKSDGVNGYIAHELLKNKLSLNLSLDYSRYQISEFASDKSNAYSGMLGLTYRPDPRISVDAQGQIISNQEYKTDTRFLIGFNYWMFSKFK